MSIRNSTSPQVRVRTPNDLGWVQKVWTLGDTWMSTVDHNPPDRDPQIQLYPLEQLGPARTDPLDPQMSHVVRRTVRKTESRPSIGLALLGVALLAAPIVMVGLAWLNGWGL